MMKKIFKKIIRLIVLIVIILGIFLIYQFFNYKNEVENEELIEEQASINNELQQELLKEKIAAATNLVTEINNEVALTILRTSGKITLSHDKTPENNKWLEWLINSDIKIYAKYNTAFTIESNLIYATVNEEDGTVNIIYDPNDIMLSYIDITEISTSDTKSIFGSNYTPSEVTALENIARDDIEKYTNTETNIEQAKKNLEMYLSVEAYNYGVSINISER